MIYIKLKMCFLFPCSRVPGTLLKDWSIFDEGEELTQKYVSTNIPSLILAYTKINDFEKDILQKDSHK